MEGYIDYSNPEVEAQIESILGDNYGAFRPLIIDTLLRRKFQFELTDEQCLREATRFKNNVETITFGDFTRNENADGLANSYRKQIRIKNRYGHKNIDLTYTGEANLLNVIQHEIAHMLVAHYKEYESTPNGIVAQEYDLNHQASILCMGLIEVGQNNEDMFCGSGIEESKTQTATGLINDISRPEDIDHGYSDLTFLHLIMAPALGISVTDLIYSSRSREALDETLLSRFNNDQSRKSEIDLTLKGIDFNMRTLHDISYIHNDYYDNMSDQEKDALATQATFGIVNQNFYLAKMQIEADKRPVTDDLANELLARYYNIFNMQERIFNGLATMGRIVNRDEFNNKTSENMKDLFTKVFGIYAVNSVKDRVTTPEELEMLSSMAKKGEIYFFKDYFKEKFDIDLETFRNTTFMDYLDNKQYLDCQYQRDVNRKDYHDGMRWPVEKTRKLIQTFMERVNADFHKGDNLEIKEQDVGSIMLKYIGLPEHYHMDPAEDKYIFLAQKMGIPAQVVKQCYEGIDFSQSYLVRSSNSQIYSRDTDQIMNYNPRDLRSQ